MSKIKVPIDRIQAGLHIRLPLQWMEHPFLFNEFKIKDEQQIALMKNIGVKFVYLTPHKSDSSILPPNLPPPVPIDAKESEYLNQLTTQLWEEKQERINKQKAYRTKIQRCESNYKKSMSQLRAVLNKINNRPLDAMDDASLLVNDMVNTLLAADNVTLHLMNNSRERDEIYSHSLNVAILSMLVGKAKKMSSDDIKTLAVGALFHDIGKMKIPSSIIRKTSPLTTPEENYFKLHTKYGLEMAEIAGNFPELVKTIIYQHHECVDGSGYPRKLKDNDIHPLAQLIAITDLYDRLCHPQNSEKTRSPHESLSFLFKTKRAQYNNEYMALLARSVGIYPPGSVVQLSNEQIGIVISVNSKQSLFPQVLVYNQNVPADQALIIDLAEKNLKITKTIPIDKISKDIYSYLNPSVRNSYYIDSDS